MDKWRKIRAKLTGRKSGKSSNRDKTLRYSRSMPLGPLRTSADTEYSNSGGQHGYDGRVLDIRGPEWPKIGQEGHKYNHHPDCDCRPRDLSQDFDDIEMIPDAVYEARKQRRESEKKDEAEKKKILHIVSSYRARVTSSNSSRSHKPIVVTDEEYDILRRYEPGFQWANRSTRSLGANVHLSGGPSPKKPQLVRNASRSTIAGSRPQIVNDRSVPSSTHSHDSHDGGSSIRSLKHQTGYRDLSRNPSAASRATTADNILGVH
ncbi:hypothetical protein EST38_g2335 [Candolleomyces aberdarensis]|uniref:Uncharacterized protein n=1 Tax=Candolleomyces aberdarensis TaxID=2316362 RepID=A0A4V1Q4W4_9AGAR|nr:hypothetical protein EST38_g2335 [Candolleomyces aberdarensis]